MRIDRRKFLLGTGAALVGLTAPAIVRAQALSPVMAGPGPHVIDGSYNGKVVFIDNSDAGFGGPVRLDASVWTTPDFRCSVKRIWDRFAPVEFAAPTGNAPNGLPYRIDEFWTSVYLIEPLSNFRFALSADGRLWTLGKDYFKWTSHRTVDGAHNQYYYMGATDRGAVLKCTPSAAPNGAQAVILPPCIQVTGTQLSDGAPSYIGAFYMIINCDPPGAGSVTNIFPRSGESLNNKVNNNDGTAYISLIPSEAVILYQSGDGTKISARSTAGA